MGALENAVFRSHTSAVSQESHIGYFYRGVVQRDWLPRGTEQDILFPAEQILVKDSLLLEKFSADPS